MSTKTDQSKQELLAHAAYLLIRKRLLDQMERANKNLKKYPKAWKEWQDELKGLEGTLLDGLTEEHS